MFLLEISAHNTNPQFGILGLKFIIICHFCKKISEISKEMEIFAKLTFFDKHFQRSPPLGKDVTT
jgi:hypothetical protein